MSLKSQNIDKRPILAIQLNLRASKLSQPIDYRPFDYLRQAIFLKTETENLQKRSILLLDSV